jgi:hypothetical protein
MATPLSKLKVRISRALEIAYGVFRIPFVLPLLCLNELRISLRLRRLTAGGPEKSWAKLVSLWSGCERFYSGPVGPYMKRFTEEIVIHRFVRLYPNADDTVGSTLTHPNPYVCAYSILTLYRVLKQRGVALKREDLPASLFSRVERIQEQSFCFGSEKMLSDVALERTNESARIPTRRPV